MIARAYNATIPRRYTLRITVDAVLRIQRQHRIARGFACWTAGWFTPRSERSLRAVDGWYAHV